MQQGCVDFLFLDGDDWQVMRSGYIETCDAHLGIDDDDINAHAGGDSDIDECLLFFLARHRRMIHAARGQPAAGGFGKTPAFGDDQHRLAFQQVFSRCVPSSFP